MNLLSIVFVDYFHFRCVAVIGQMTHTGVYNLKVVSELSLRCIVKVSVLYLFAHLR